MNTSEAPQSPLATATAKSYQRTCLVIRMAILALAVFGLLYPVAFPSHIKPGISMFFFVYQDDFLLLPLLPALTLYAVFAKTSDKTWWTQTFTRPAAIAGLLLLLLMICWAGHFLIFRDYDLSRDEQMANFDAYIFSHGRLLWPIEPAWRRLADALNTTFMLPVGSHDAWVSAYLPVNAAIRAMVGKILPPSITGPLLVAIAGVALWKIAARLWPNSAPTRAVVMTLFLGSAQVLANAMTSYAMTAHLALNLVWLALFLDDRYYSHAVAIVAGFLATGLHQPVFHPLFVLPFIGLLVAERRWRLVVFYTLCYGLISAFWFAWPAWMASQFPGIAAVQGGHGVGYLARLVETVSALDTAALWLMALNLVRFATWQHLLLLPLLGFGLRVAWRGEPLARALAAGFLLPIVAMLILLPYQGHGWGYRYIHGVMGNACLLAGYGWYRLEANGLSLRRVLAWTSALTFLLIIPCRIWQIHRMVTPYAQLNQKIGQTGADIAIIDDTSVFYSSDLVLNRPDLSNRPIRLMASQIQPSDIASLCARRKIVFFDGPHMQSIMVFFGQKPAELSRQIKKLSEAAHDARCAITPVP